MRLFGGLFAVTFLGLMWGSMVQPAAADMYLTRSETGTLQLTNRVPADTGGQPVKLLLKSQLPDNANVPSVRELRTIVEEASNTYDIPRSLIYAVIEVESDGETEATSHAGARGLMQLMPETAEDMGVQDPLDPRENIFGGTRYLRMVLNAFDGDLDLALAAYNAGPTNVRKHDGIPPFEQTQAFVKRVRRRFRRFKSEGDMIYTYKDENGVTHVTNIH